MSSGEYDLNGKCVICGHYHPCECECQCGDREGDEHWDDRNDPNY